METGIKPEKNNNRKVEKKTEKKTAKKKGNIKIIEDKEEKQDKENKEENIKDVANKEEKNENIKNSTKAENKEEKAEENIEDKNGPGGMIEAWDLLKTPKMFPITPVVQNVFSRKFYKFPLKLFNENIKLLDKNMQEIPHDIRTVTIDPFEIRIITYFNENNQGVLKDASNNVITTVCPKYEHYINWSVKANHMFITCDSNQDPAFLQCVEINVVLKMFRNGKVLREKIMLT